ncbi:CHAP domain-containing protein [Paracoccus sp. MBLB3053]|uniref:CHAP domain-containing protein n=1 Tax=Paracoccus aurantius TaxID=3073814 RepID=A0ABU2HXY3_9RHOB|nr:CHAP domain-containing protein [Paracoccus sp. MBLB3053]MDS9469908.1 CHAP domain-containing protein [Paracoccus sp. MBLB3053]
MMDWASRRACIAGIAVCMMLAGCSEQAAQRAQSSSGVEMGAKISKHSDVSLGRISPERMSLALLEVKTKQTHGTRVWCVPFARTLSGVQLMGNAKEWWGNAKGHYARGTTPTPAAVMSFKATRKNPNGHVAVVSKVISERKVLVSHANWRRNTVSIDMAAVDVSAKNDWSSVRLESVPGHLGAAYPVDGFIYPQPAP